MMQVMDGEPTALPDLHHLNSYLNCDGILAWLVGQHLTGREFVAWSRHNFGVSMVKMSSHILSRIERKEDKKILYGIDII
jgi:hypothetical protein